MHEDDLKLISFEALQFNMKQIDVVRTLLSIVGGVLTGTLGNLMLSFFHVSDFPFLIGCQREYGLLAFVILYFVISLSLALKMNFNVKKYTNSSIVMFGLADLQKNGLSFVLFWTLSYALIYIY